MPIIGSLGAAASRGFGQFLQKITAVLNTDAFFSYVTLLLTGNPPVSTFITDASTNNLQVTINGDTKPSGFSPNEGGYYSNYFDGSGDYLTGVSNTNLAVGTNQYTVEFWIYFNTVTATNEIFRTSTDSTSGRLAIYYASGSLQLTATGGAGQTTASFTFVSGQWYHVAGSRDSSNNQRLFVNGVLLATSTSTNNYSQSGFTLGQGQGSGNVNGYISNLRLVNGTALYTAAFTPPTTPLTSVSGTSLLTCQSNRFIDNSTNALAITASGNTTVNSFQPFTPNPSFATYGSTYFDGNGDYLTVPANNVFAFGTGDYTIEFWVYSVIAYSGVICLYNNNSGGYFLQYNTGVGLQTGVAGVSATGTYSTTLIANSWNHIAVSRASGSSKCFVNGTQVGTTLTDNTNYAQNGAFIGALFNGAQPLNGYLSNFRIVKGTALYTSNFTPPATQLTAVTNTSLLTCQTNQPVNNNVFLDSSSRNLAITRAGNTTQGSLNPYGANWSVQTDNGANLSVPANTALRLTGDFTIEAWIYPTTVGNSVIVGSDAGSPSDYFGILSNRIQIGINGGSYPTWTTSFVANTWYHVALTRSSNFLRAFVNGTQLTLASGSATNSGTMFQANALLIGKYGYTVSALPFYGNISNLRIVKGTALYTASFTPSTAPLTAVTNTVLLTCQSNRYVDNSLNNFTVSATGLPKAQRFSPFSPVLSTPTSYSNYFDGSGDYLTLPSNQSQFSMGTGDFTIEMWVNISSLAAARDLYDTSNAGDANPQGRFAIEVTTSGYIRVYQGTGQDITTGGSLSVGLWYHIAYVRISGSGKLYVNGVQVNTTATDTNNYVVGTVNRPIIGVNAYDGGSNPMLGFISNLRVVKGTGVYTANFTPPTTPLTAVSGTSLLTCQSPTIIDNSANNFAITATGDVAARTQNPFGVTNTDAPYTPATYGGSMYFDGTNDYLIAPLGVNSALGNTCTVELWYYPLTSPPTARLINNSTAAGSSLDVYDLDSKIGFANQVATTTTVRLNAWTHIAFVVTSGTLKIYFNGVSQPLSGTSTGINITATGDTWIGGINGYSQWTNGYMSNIRLVKGTALYAANFAPPVAPLQAVTNTTLLLLGSNGAVYDSAMFNDSETLGDSKTSTAQSKFGGSSVSFDGSGDSLMIPASNRYQFQANYTIELWVYFNSVTGTQDILGNYVSSTAVDWTLLIDNQTIQYYPSSAASFVWGPAMSTNTWYHIALVRSGSTCSMYVNGVSVGTPLTFSTVLGSPTKPLYVGSRAGGSNYFNGYIDDLRITNGYARYTQNFAVPTEPFPVQ